MVFLVVFFLNDEYEHVCVLLSFVVVAISIVISIVILIIVIRMTLQSVA